MADASEAGVGGTSSAAGLSTGLPPTPSIPCSPAHSLHHRVPAGCEVVFVAIDEGHPEVKEQVDEKGPRVLCQEYLGVRGQLSHPNIADGRESLAGLGLTVTQLIWAPRSRK